MGDSQVLETSDGRTGGERDGWTLKVPSVPPDLEDTPLPRSRHPRERAALAVSLLALAAGCVTAVVLHEREVVLALAALWLSMAVIAVQAPTANRLRGAEVTATQFPGIHGCVEELRRRFGAPPTQVFVIRNPVAQAYAYGIRPPYVIVLHSALLDALDADELRYVLGQQLGHVCFGHTRMAVLLGGDQSSLPAVLKQAASVRDLVFAWYRRTQVMSTDRAGALACGDVETAVRAQLKLAVGTAQVDQIQPADLLRQAFTVTQGVNRLQAVLIRIQSTAPPLISRLEALLEWTGAPGQHFPTPGRGR